MLLIVLSAALAGIVHVLTGPDHMAAVAPLAIADRQRGWLAGWTWGLGHASGVVVVAVLAVLLRDLLPPIDFISSWGEKFVGGALIAIGVWALRRGFDVGTSSHTHHGVPHVHMYVRKGPRFMQRLGHAHAAFLMGTLHGIAGTSHFLGVLPALALPTLAAALTYVLTFGVATVAAMTAFAAVVGAVAGRSAVHGTVAHRALTLAGAVVAIVVGGFWVLSAAEKPPDDYKKAMTTLATFVQDMSKPDASEDFPLAKKYVPIVRDAFADVEKYWTDRNADRQFFPEINTAREGIKLASDMGVAANLSSAEGVAAAVKDISGRCQPCHDAHREKAPDGTFLIK